jgi:hypothetical protein
MDLYTFKKIHSTINFNWMHFMACELCSNKINLEISISHSLYSLLWLGSPHSHHVEFLSFPWLQLTEIQLHPNLVSDKGVTLTLHASLQSAPLVVSPANCWPAFPWTDFLWQSSVVQSSVVHSCNPSYWEGRDRKIMI